MRDIININRICYQRYEKRLEQQRGRPNVSICFAEEHFEEEQFNHQCLIIISNQIGTLKIFFVTQTFRVFIVRIHVFWCEIRVYLKSLNGSPAWDLEHRHLGR